jgi:hypothetical protein
MLPLRPTLRFVGTPDNPHDGEALPAVVTYPLDNAPHQPTDGHCAPVSDVQPFHAAMNTTGRQ